jgi:hypothetical protein
MAFHNNDSLLVEKVNNGEKGCKASRVIAAVFKVELGYFFAR